ncbi:gluconate 2-dehydrogenase subunit 3 family protein [Ammoniphilus resinae]|uniref:Gluconate 2-dehydrogenase subunit 3 family protein n=1 Tax=Ammoniphilus resinae TaxID=861532 RepID=A0ABS4GLM1_9BACL|nr:gluconate 2-dehydrogenase subunit 3 family protein [Ammoniphilus resinae]MBP1931141.1 hypothetical protein [Ammoniphilus resinae]
MSEHKLHYPDFNVLNAEEHWDPHTREIVDKRLETQTFFPPQFLTEQEIETLFHLCSVLLDDQRKPVIAFVVHHFDSTLKASIGESQRKIGVPEQSVLIRGGLTLLNQVCNERYGGAFHTIDENLKIQVVGELMQGNLSVPSNAQSVPAKDFADKILSVSVAAYYSHPTIWSEIGYAGPAYPRGYVRSELGLTDPWEARRNVE